MGGKRSALRRLGIHVLLLASAVSLAGCGSSDGLPSDGGGAAGSSIIVKGSDTMVNLALAWAEAYMSGRPEIDVSVSGGGSGTGLTAILNGTVDIANASREAKAEELETARTSGITLTEYVVAYDAIAIVVHPSNPVDGLTLGQLSDIYRGRITNWQQVGGEDRPIVLLSRESNSGTYVYFLEHVVRLGEDVEWLFSPDALLMPSSEGISAEVRQNPNAIGYDGMGYVTPDQKVVGVAREAGGDFVLASAESVKAGTYPIARKLYMYTAGQPTGATADYIEWILGPGQGLITGLGFVPLR